MEFFLRIKDFVGLPGLMIIFSILLFALITFIYIMVDTIKKAYLFNKHQLWLKKLTEKEKRVEESEKALHILSKEKSIGFPWLAEAYADFLVLKDLEISDNLEKKYRPALRAAEQIREMAYRRRLSEKAARVYEYQIKYYESLFPWLLDYKEEDIEEDLIQISDDDEAGHKDPVAKWLTPEEYKCLSTTEKNQIALNRYWSQKKSKWSIGRDYERYIGYKYETEGWNVIYHGIIEGFADFGRDLIATKNNQVKIIQCKNWAKEKTIHEKHIFQLYGSMTAYRIKRKKENPNFNIAGVFITSTKLSEKAKEFAAELNITYREKIPFEKYPCIKCNISRRDNEKIYHLPFDQQYDNTLIEKNREEFYANTVEEAESKGFRRAWRHSV